LKTTLLTVESVTQAVRAKRLLARHGLRAKLVKNNSINRGCVYTLEIRAADLLFAASLLRAEGISYTAEKRDDV